MTTLSFVAGLLLGGKAGLFLALYVRPPYATGPAPVYYESGYLPTADFWRLGTIFGLLFLGSLLAIGVPLLMLR